MSVDKGGNTFCGMAAAGAMGEGEVTAHDGVASLLIEFGHCSVDVKNAASMLHYNEGV